MDFTQNRKATKVEKLNANHFQGNVLTYENGSKYSAISSQKLYNSSSIEYHKDKEALNINAILFHFQGPH